MKTIVDSVQSRGSRIKKKPIGKINKIEKSK